MRFGVQWDLDDPRMLLHVGDGLKLPPRFTARFEYEEDHTVELVVQITDDVPTCEEIRIVRNPERPPLTGSEAARLEVERLVRYAAAMTAFIPKTDDSWEGMNAHIDGRDWTINKTDDQVREIEATFDRRRRRRVITDDFLRDVAAIYMDNIDDAPTLAVKEHFHAGKSTAGDWVKAAADRGFLPKATRGKKRGAQ